MILIAREQYSGKLIQALDASDFIMAKFDLGVWHIFHPYLFDQNMAFERVGGFFGDVKIFWPEIMH